jgi:glycopeptide antibiotics resistance protein
MPSPTPAPTIESKSSSWAERILLLSSAGILFLTLFPFRFVAHLKGSEGMVPFFHGSMGKDASAFNAFLNVLLFMPFGFGLAEKLRERGKSRSTTAAIAFVAGVLFSYTVETLQIYIPTRDSGWGDVITNSSGSVLGFLAYEFCGKSIVATLHVAENTLARFLRPATVTFALLMYFAIWFAVSPQLQATARLTGWNPDPILVLGNDTLTHPWEAWKGQVLRLELWDRAVPDSAALALTASHQSYAIEPGRPHSTVAFPAATYDVSSGLAPQDLMKSLPALMWRPAVAPQDQALGLALEGQTWLVSEAPVSTFVGQIENSNQFSIRIACRPADAAANEGGILSLGAAGLPADLSIRQQGPGLVFWFHTALSARRAQLAWTVPNVFDAGEARDILYSYDGANLSLFIDGKKEPRPYVLGAGAALARTIRRIKPAELVGYRDIYYALIFFPAGILLGLAARQTSGAGWLLLGVILIAPPWLLEALLARAGPHGFFATNAMLSLAFFLAGALWINVRPIPRPSAYALGSGRAATA